VLRHESYRAKIVRVEESEDGETTTEITREVTNELASLTVTDEDLSALCGLTEKAFDAISECDLTYANFANTSQDVKVAVSEAFWAAMKAAPRGSVVDDALYAWYLNAMVFVIPRVGVRINPVLASKWVNADGIDVRDLDGKVLMVEFFGTWCPPCRAATPHLVATYNKYHEKGFEVISVSKRRRGQVSEEKFSKAFKVTYPIAIDKPSAVFDQNGRPWRGRDGGLLVDWYNLLSYQSEENWAGGVPRFFLADKDGMIIMEGHPGADAEKIDAALEEMLEDQE
jgi:thiol-disulfide isomerase/thioredoxin